jgi:hypothetical protein
VVIESCANRRLRPPGRPVNIFFAAATATAGVAIGWGQRTIIFRLATPTGDLPRLACAGCGHQIPGSRLAWWLPLTPSGRCVACQARIGPPPAAVELTARHTVTYLGMPNFSSSVGRASPDVRPCPP